MLFDKPAAANPIDQLKVVGKPTDRILEVFWHDGRVEIDRDTEIAVDVFCEYLANAIDTITERRLLKRCSTSTGPRA